MGRLFKFLFSAVIFVVLLVVAAVILVPMFVDPNDYKDEIAAQVKKATGRDLEIGGKIGLSVFPWLGLELNRLEMSNAPGFGDTPFAAVEHAQVRAKLMPLLQQQLEVDKVLVKGVTLNLARSADGTANWDDLAGGAAPGEGKQSAQPGRGTGTGEPSGAEQLIGGLAIGGVSIEDSRVVWDDRAAGQRFEIDDLSLEADTFVLGQPLALTLGFLLESVEPALKARIDVDGQVQTDARFQQISLLPFNLTVRDLQAEGMTGEASLAGQVRADLETQSYAISGLEFTAHANGEGLPPAGAAIELMAELALDLANQTLDLTGMEVNAGRLHLTGEAHGSQIKTAPQFQGDLKLAEFSPRQLLADLGVEPPATSDPEVLKRASASFKLESDPKSIRLQPLAMVLDDSKLDGQLKLLTAAQSAVRFDLAVDAIDLDRYLPPPADDSGSPKPPPSTNAPAASKSPAAPAPLFPVETLRGLDVQGEFRIGTLIIQKLQARDISLGVSSKGGLLRLEDKVNSFYDGGLKGTMSLDVRGAKPKLKVQQHLTKVQVGPLLKDLSGKDHLIGTGQFNANLNATGQSQDALTRSLGGKLDFSFLDGAVKGINLAKIIREAKAKYTGKPLPASNEPDQTDFSELTGSAVITKGLLVNKDLLAKSPYLRITGAGEVNLVAQNLDYTVTPVVVSTAKGQGGEGLEELKGVPVPVQLTGAFDDLDYQIDFKAVLVATQGAKLDKKIDDKLDKALGDKVDSDTKDQLKGMLKGFMR